MSRLKWVSVISRGPSSVIGSNAVIQGNVYIYMGIPPKKHEEEKSMQIRGSVIVENEEESESDSEDFSEDKEWQK